MNTWLLIARSIHFASTMLLFGGLLFVLVIAMPAWRDAGFAVSSEGQAFWRKLTAVAAWSIVASLASGLAWLAFEAAMMSGLPVTQAMHRDTLALVLGKTEFGRLWTLRFGLALALAALLWTTWRSEDDSRKRHWAVVALVVAAAYLAALAWAGHAAAGEGRGRYLQLVSDVIHLLCAAAWLGALPGLALLLGSVAPLDIAARAARRFSTLGVTSVSALALSGLVNAWFLVGDVPALVGTPYGRLLSGKLAFFAAMVALAAVNRLVLTPRLAAGKLPARRFLRRNALLETAAGICVVTIVGVLGITIPGAHQAPVWPFDYTMEWRPAQESAMVRALLAAAGLAACIGTGVAITGARGHRARLVIAGLAAIVAAAATSAWLLAMPAYPTSYAASPVRYSTDSIVRGAALYADNCSACHGAHGHGDGPAAAPLSIKPPDLAQHALHHRAGDLFWWIAHGIPATPMPGFAGDIGDTDIWTVVQFLHALSDAEAARTMTGSVEPWRPIVAPDFTFELAAHEQETLVQQRERHVVLVVFYTLPRSLPRLRALGRDLRAFADAGVRVVAVRVLSAAMHRDSEAARDDNSMSANTGPDVATAYANFTHMPGDNATEIALGHAEFLIDRQGYLRARWIGVADGSAARTADILAQIQLLNRERHAPASEAHTH